MSVIIKNPLTVIKESSPAKPTTWAELKAMSTTDLQAIYPEGSVIDLPCLVKNPADLSQTDNWGWIVENYGPGRLENDATDYPCVTLVARDCARAAYAFDAKEQVLADQTSEPLAIAGTFYYGTSSTSGNPTSSNTTKLSLTAGDTIPYGDYARIFKTDIDATVADFIAFYTGGYANYALSNIRQWLNADAESDWFSPSHIGDVAPAYQNQAGFLYCLPADFKAVLSPTAVHSAFGAGVDLFDKIFLPSKYELRFAFSPIEGDIWSGIQRIRDRIWSRVGADRTVFPNTGEVSEVYLRSHNTLGGISSVHVTAQGGLSYSIASGNHYIAPACRIILAS